MCPNQVSKEERERGNEREGTRSRRLIVKDCKKRANDCSSFLPSKSMHHKRLKLVLLSLRFSLRCIQYHGLKGWQMSSEE